MSYSPPMFAGMVLMMFAFISAFFIFEVVPLLAIILVVGAIFISLPYIRKVQVSKDGVVIEPSEWEPRGVPRTYSPVSPSSIPNLTVYNPGFVLAFLYSYISGLISGLWMQSYANPVTLIRFINMTTIEELVPAMAYSITLIAILYKFSSMNKTWLPAIIPVVFVAWIAALEIGKLIMNKGPLGRELYDKAFFAAPISGFVGALLLMVGLSILVQRLRTAKAILCTSAVGIVAGIAGGAYMLIAMRLSNNITHYSVQILVHYALVVPVFVLWQVGVTMSIAYHLLSWRRTEGW
jgi:hypothetical protein